MTAKELKIWLIAMIAVGINDILLGILPNEIVLMAVYLFIGIVMEAVLAFSFYIAAAFCLNLLLGRLHFFVRAALTVALIAASAFIVAPPLNRRIDDEVAAIRAGDRLLPPTVVRRLAFYTVTPQVEVWSQEVEESLCDEACMALLFSHRAEKVIYAHGLGPASSDWDQKAAVIFSLVQGPCPKLQRPYYDALPRYRDRHFKLTGECLTQGEGSVSDADAVIVPGPEARDNEPVPPIDIGELTRDTIYIHDASGRLIPGGSHAFFHINHYTGLWIMTRPVKLYSHEDTAHIDIYGMRTSERHYRPEGTKWVEALGIPLAPAQAPDLGAVRARIWQAVNSPASFSEDTVAEINTYVDLLAERKPDLAGRKESFYPNVHDLEDTKLIRRLSAEPRLSGWLSNRSKASALIYAREVVGA